MMRIPMESRSGPLKTKRVISVQNETNVPDGLSRSSLAEDDTDDLVGKSCEGEGGLNGSNVSEKHVRL